MTVPIDVVFPCLNEAEALPVVLAAVPPRYRAIVVDNGSTDGSADVALLAGAVVVHEPSRGYGAAVHAGLAAATSDLVIVCDADGTIDPADFDALVTPVRVGDVELAIGRRRPVSRAAWPLPARVANLVLARMLRSRTGLPSATWGPCGPRGGRRCSTSR
ncbi:glycosyltransferase family 2 protein [Leifsonia xyli]|uniref:glycosyltransferase family 2 protein n=1 Tax=Leifsonia xyli TaxID=1575 RepID=UPI003D66BC5B